MTRMELNRDVLKDRRHAAGLTQEALATKAGLSETAVNWLETGRTKEAKVSTARKIADALGCSITDIAVPLSDLAAR